MFMVLSSVIFIICNWTDNKRLTTYKLFDVKYYRDLVYGFLFAFHGNYGHICSYFGDIQRQRMA